MTRILDFACGPGVGKSLLSALIYAEMKRRGYNVEYVQEYPKKLVWLERFEELNNQYNISFKQYRILKALQGKVDYLIFDSSLISGLYYNKYNPDNNSNVEKTEQAILKWYKEFNTRTIFLQRGDYVYENSGRYQSFEEAQKVDTQIHDLLEEQKIHYFNIASDIRNVDAIIDILVV